MYNFWFKKDKDERGLWIPSDHFGSASFVGSGSAFNEENLDFTNDDECIVQFNPGVILVFISFVPGLFS